MPPPNLGLSHRVGPLSVKCLRHAGWLFGRCLFSATSYFCAMLLLGDGRWSILEVTPLGDNRLFILQNAASTYDDYVDFLTTYLSLIHVITPNNLVGTPYYKNVVITDAIGSSSYLSPSKCIFFYTKWTFIGSSSYSPLLYTFFFIQNGLFFILSLQ